MFFSNDATDTGPLNVPQRASSRRVEMASLAQTGKIRVLIVDDSQTMQWMLHRILSGNPEIEVVGCARDGREALAKIPDLLPDVVTLDVRLPEMDGLETLRLIRERNREIRVIMCSSDTERGAKATLEALMAGASYCVAKPNATESGERVCVRFAEEIVRKVCMHRTRSATASGAHLARTAVQQVDRPSKSGDAISSGVQQASVKLGSGQQAAARSATRGGLPEVLAIGTSTGGPAALSDILPMLPADFPLPVLIVQHMPPLFTRQLAERLSRLSRVSVVEGQHGMEVRPGLAIIAPGDHHMRVVRRINRVEIVLTQDEPENSCRPAVDVLFRSVAEVYGARAIAAVLTGMGQDGLQGTHALTALGNPVLVQDRSTSVVWGMPRAVAEAGLAAAILPLHEIIPEVMRRI